MNNMTIIYNISKLTKEKPRQKLEKSGKRFGGKNNK